MELIKKIGHPIEQGIKMMQPTRLARFMLNTIHLTAALQCIGSQRPLIRIDRERARQVCAACDRELADKPQNWQRRVSLTSETKMIRTVLRRGQASYHTVIFGPLSGRRDRGDRLFTIHLNPSVSENSQRNQREDDAGQGQQPISSFGYDKSSESP